MVDSLIRDLKMAGRSMRRRPGFTIVSVFILALAIGGVTVMFTVLNGAILEPMPFADPERLVWVASITDRGTDNSVSALDYYDYEAGATTFESLAARLLFKPRQILTGSGEPEQVVSTKVSANLFATLGFQPALGRTFTAEEQVVDGPAVVVVSHGFWQRRLESDPEAVGQTVEVDGAAVEVVGVMPEGFGYPKGVDLWYPMVKGGRAESGRGNNNFFVIGRLAEGATMDQAQAEMGGIASRIAAENPRTKAGWTVGLTSLHERFYGDARPAMMLLMAATLAVLLIAVANLSSLFLAKVISRRGELAVRLALGAPPWVVLRQLLVESLVVATVGAAAGVGLAVLGLNVIKTLAPSAIPRLDSIGIDLKVLVVAVMATVAAGILFGSLPALKGSRVSLVTTLREARQSTEGVRSQRLRQMLVATQVALSVVLLVGAGFLIRSVYDLQKVDPGFDPDHLVTMRVELPGFRYQEPEEAGNASRELLARSRALPGVADAALSDSLPFQGGLYNGIYRPENPPETPSDACPATRRMVSENFFRTLGVPVLAGRDFEAGDRLDGPPVTVISRSLAEELFPDENPLGKIIVLPWNDGIHLEIVGVVGDVRDFGLDVDIRPLFYLPMAQYPGTSLRMVARAEGEPGALVPLLREEVRAVERDAPVTGVRTMQELINDSTSDSDFVALLLGVFAAIALALAATGLYGAVAHFVADRRREIGIRVALGARPLSVALWVLRRAIQMAGTGLVAGLLLAALLSRSLEEGLFAAASPDPLTFATVGGVLLAVALLACAVPTFRALNSDSAATLREE